MSDFEHDESICQDAHESAYGTAASLAVKRFSEAFAENLVLAIEDDPEKGGRIVHHLAQSLIVKTQMESHEHHTGDSEKDAMHDMLAIMMMGYMFGRAVEEISVTKLADAHELTFQH